MYTTTRMLQNRGKVGKIRVESLREIATNFSFDHLENDILNCMQDLQYYGTHPKII